MNLFRRKAASPDAEVAERVFSQLKSQVEGIRRTVLFDQELGLYQRWYFEFRLREEVARSSRYGTPFAVLVVALQADQASKTWPLLVSRAAYAISHAVRAVDLTAVLDPGVFAVCLLNCGQEGAEIAAGRVANALQDIPFSMGGTLFPDDSLDADDLLKQTRQRAA